MTKILPPTSGFDQGEDPRIKRMPRNEREWKQFVRSLNVVGKSFTPSWTGFSTPPTGDIDYVSYGGIVVLITGAKTGTSNATTFTIANVPTEIRPSKRQQTSVWALNEGEEVLSLADIETDGNIYFIKGVSTTETTSGDVVIRATTGNWTASGSKGLDRINIVYSLI